ncbi:MAG: formylglycine-generating enzyme family protein [Planctomycetaceae bacterium]|nr:MAG: formylglycine-generating enzyme family protein [Planctomycetaceae bacterium]
MRRITRAALICAVLFLAIGCGTSGDDAVKEEKSGELAGLLQKEITIDLGNGVTLEMVLIPAGEFLMGSSESELQWVQRQFDAKTEDWGEQERENVRQVIASEGPQHRVRITRPFYLGKYPVTQEQWVALMRRNPSGESLGREKPVERVSWNDCQEFLDKLNERLGETVGKFRLPTEAEWEYAGRAGATTRYSFGDDADQSGEYAWHGHNSNGTRPVGQKKPNAWGLYDVHGNVREWCADWFDVDYYANSPMDDPQGPASGAHRVVRGCSWLGRVQRLAARNGLEPGFRDYGLGFRLALVPAEGKTTKAEAPVERPEVDQQPSAADQPPGSASAWKFPPDSPQPAIAPFGARQARRHQEEWAEHLRRPVELTNSIGMKLRLIPPGEFMMGSPEWDEEGRESKEGPQHLVRITRPFYFGVYEVTQGEYERVMGTNPSAFSQEGARSEWVSGMDTSRFPVDQVSWEEAVEFCRRLSALPAERSAGRKYRLPTEAEWEYACRAGTTTPFHFGSVLDGQQANCNASFPYGTRGEGRWLGRPTAVGSYRPNGFGLFDMHGNVREWCADWADWADWYDPHYYAISPVNDPTGPSSGWIHVSRGGSWSDIARSCRSAARNEGTSAGFRVCYGVEL